MNPMIPASAMSQGGTFMRPGAMAWGQPDPASQAPASETTHQQVLQAVERAVRAAPGQEYPIDVAFPGEGEPDLLDEWISAHAEPFYIRP